MALVRATSFSDDFNRPDNTDLGAAWDAGYTGRAGFQIVDQDIRSNTGTGLICIETVNSFIPGTSIDCWAEAQITNFDDGGGTVAVGVVLRYANPATDSGYWLFARSGANNTQLYRVDSGTLNSLGVLANPGWVNGDLISLEIRGTVLTAFRNGLALALTATDANYTSGRIGGVLSTPTGLQANAQIDNFAGGIFKPGASGGRFSAGRSRSSARSLRIPRIWRL